MGGASVRWCGCEVAWVVRVRGGMDVVGVRCCGWCGCQVSAGAGVRGLDCSVHKGPLKQGPKCYRKVSNRRTFLEQKCLVLFVIFGGYLAGTRGVSRGTLSGKF